MISPDDKTKLTGRIYPAIKSCVNNRYRVIVGLLVYYAFIFRSSKFSEIIRGDKWISLFISIAFGIFVLLNSLNYCLNAKEQIEIEKNRELKWCEVLGESYIEIAFAVLLIAFITIAHLVFIDP